MPQTAGADDATVLLGGEGEALRRKPAFAQALGRLQAASLSEAGVEELLAGDDVAGHFITNLDQSRTLPERWAGDRTSPFRLRPRPSTCTGRDCGVPPPGVPQGNARRSRHDREEV